MLLSTKDEDIEAISRFDQLLNFALGFPENYPEKSPASGSFWNPQLQDGLIPQKSSPVLWEFEVFHDDDGWL